MAKKKILIVGGGGFIGKWLLKSFSINGWETSVIDPNVKKSALKSFSVNHIFNYSINDNELLSNALKSENWNAVICLAAWGGDGNGLLKAANEDFRKALEVNVSGFANLLDKMKNFNNTKFFWSSSTVVYGEESIYSNKKVNEKSTLSPITHYGLTKVLAEEVSNFFIREYKMNITGLRLPIVIGPGLNYRGVASGVSDMANATKEKRDIIVDMPDTPLDIIYVKDVPEIFVKLINSKLILKNIYNAPSYRTYADQIANHFNKHTNTSNVKINNIGSGTTYPKMQANSFQKDIKYSLKYTLEKSIKDWINEL